MVTGPADAAAMSALAISAGGALAVGGQRPQPMADAVVVGHLEVGRAGGREGQALPGRAGRVLEQRDDRARVDAGRAEQLVAVLAGARQRPLVRQDAAVRPERLEPQPRRRTRAGSAPSSVPGTTYVCS